jgi:hypothetical protein
MTLSEGQTADLSTADHVSSSADPVFSDLIDRWLREGDRLEELAGPPAGTHPGDSPTQLDGWKLWARNLLGTVIERHRLEVLVGIGLIPLALFLIVAHHAAPPSTPARTVAALAPAARPRAVLAEPPMTVLAPRPAAPEPVLTRYRPLALASTPAAPAKPLVSTHVKPVAQPKQPPVRPRPVAIRAPHPAPPVQVAKPQPPAPPRPAIAIVPRVTPPAHPAPKVMPKAAFAVDPRVAPNLKLGATRRP